MLNTKVDLKQIRPVRKKKMSSQTNILDLPTEILEMIFRRISSTKDVENCQKACEIYTDPRISKILSQIQFDNEGIFIYFNFESISTSIEGFIICIFYYCSRNINFVYKYFYQRP